MSALTVVVHELAGPRRRRLRQLHRHVRWWHRLAMQPSAPVTNAPGHAPRRMDPRRLARAPIRFGPHWRRQRHLPRSAATRTCPLDRSGSSPGNNQTWIQGSLVPIAPAVDDNRRAVSLVPALTVLFTAAHGRRNRCRGPAATTDCEWHRHGRWVASRRATASNTLTAIGADTVASPAHRQRDGRTTGHHRRSTRSIGDNQAGFAGNFAGRSTDRSPC